MDPLSHRVIEKRRRDRMNNCLADLNRLIPPYYLKKGRGRVEKTEIIEMAIKYMQHLQQQLDFRQIAATALTGGGGDPQLDQWAAGYQDAMARTLQFLVEVEGLFSGDALCVRLLSYLSKHCKRVVAREGFSARKSTSSPASSSGYQANGSSSDNGNYSNCASNDSNTCSPDNPSFPSKKTSPAKPAGGDLLMQDYGGDACAATDANASSGDGDELPRGGGHISSKMSLSSNSSGTVSCLSGSSGSSGSKHRNDSGYYTAGSSSSAQLQPCQKGGAAPYGPGDHVPVKQESAGADEFSGGDGGGYRCVDGNSGYDSGDNGNSRTYDHGNSWHHGYPMVSASNMAYGNVNGGGFSVNAYGNSYGYDGTNRSSGTNSCSGDNSSSDNCFAAVKEPRPKDCGAFGGSSRSPRGAAPPRSLELVSSSPAGAEVGQHASGRRPRSAVEHGTRDPAAGSVGDHKLERTSASVPVSSATDVAEQLTVERSASEVPLRSMLQHAPPGPGGACKSVRNEYFSSDNGSNTSSSGGEDNPSRLYKFKSNMKHRFSVDLEHSSHPAKKQRRDSGSSSSNYDQYESVGRSGAPGNLCAPREAASPHKEHRDRAALLDKFKVKELSRPASVLTGIPPRLPTATQPDDALRTPVPIFAFNQSGSFYVPMSVDPSVVASAMSAKPEISPVLHPISIYVNFTPTCLGTSITMSPLPAAPPVVRAAYPDPAISKQTYSTLACDGPAEDVKPVLRGEPKQEHVPPVPMTARGAPEAYPCNSPLKDHLEDKANVLNYSEMTRPPGKASRGRNGATKCGQDGPRDSEVPRGHHAIPDQRPPSDPPPQMCKVRHMRELTSYPPGQQQVGAHLSRHTSAMPLPLHATLSTALPTAHPPTNMAAHTTPHLPPISVFSAPPQTLPSRIPHQLQHSGSHPSSRLVREPRNHREPPTPPNTVRDYFEPTSYGAGYQRSTLPWPYHLPARPFKA